METFRLDPNEIILVKIGPDMNEPDNVLWVTASDLIEIIRAQRIPTGSSRQEKWITLQFKGYNVH